MSTLLSSASSGARAMDDAKSPMCLSPQDKLKGSSAKASLAAAAQRIKTASASVSAVSAAPISMAVAVSALAMDFDMADAVTMDLDGDLDLDLVDDSSSDHDMDDAGWVSDDNLRALEFDDRLNQDIDWVAHDDVETALKLEFIPSSDDVQDFVFDPSSFLSPLRGGLSFDDSDMSSSFAESLSVDTPPPSFGTTSHDAEKLLMSFDTMNFTIPSPTSSTTKKRASLFGKKDASADNATDKSGGLAADVAARQSLNSKGSMSPSLKLKAGMSADEARKDDSRASLSKLAIPATEPFLGVLSITTPTKSSQVVDTQKKIGSYSPEARRLRIQKFHEKRKNRTWKKSIKYDCRKKLADDRPRIKGRFVRVLENTTDVKDEDSCSTTCSSSSGSPAPSTGSPCAGSPVKVEPVASAPAAPVPVAAVAATLLAAQLQPVPAMAVAPAPVVAAVPTPASAPTPAASAPTAVVAQVVLPVAAAAPIAPVSGNSA